MCSQCGLGSNYRLEQIYKPIESYIEETEDSS